MFWFLLQNNSWAPSGEVVVQLRRSNAFVATPPVRSPGRTVQCTYPGRKVLSSDDRSGDGSEQNVPANRSCSCFWMPETACLPTQAEECSVKFSPRCRGPHARLTLPAGTKRTPSIGVMFTEISLDERGSILSTVMNRVSETLRNNLTLQNFSQISISTARFPRRLESGHYSRQSGFLS